MKITFPKSLCFLALLSGLYSYSQESNTVFVTGELKKEKMKRSFFEEAGTFTTFLITVPLRYNPEYGSNNPNYTYSDTWYIPDGINLHAGYGIHTTQTLGLSVNAGIDAVATAKMASIPIYASLLINPQINDDTALRLQAGIGEAFAIGRGNLSGLYQKYQFGITLHEKLTIFAEVNFYGYGIYTPNQISCLGLGLSIINFK